VTEFEGKKLLILGANPETTPLGRYRRKLSSTLYIEDRRRKQSISGMVVNIVRCCLRACLESINQNRDER